MKLLRTCALPLLSLAWTGLLLAQISSTSLRGTVTDPSGSVVSGATVVVQSTESNIKRTVVTNSLGEYQFQFLPPGTYVLSVAAQGFERYQQSSLQLLVNTPATANVRLRLGTTS